MRSAASSCRPCCRGRCPRSCWCGTESRRRCTSAPASSGRIPPACQFPGSAQPSRSPASRKACPKRTRRWRGPRRSQSRCGWRAAPDARGVRSPAYRPARFPKCCRSRTGRSACAGSATSPCRCRGRCRATSRYTGCRRAGARCPNPGLGCRCPRPACWSRDHSCRSPKWDRRHWPQRRCCHPSSRCRAHPWPVWCRSARPPYAS